MEEFTWPQAKNRLITGMLKAVKYHPRHNAANTFICKDGVIHRVWTWDYNRKHKVGDITPGEPDCSRTDTFVEVPAWKL